MNKKILHSVFEQQVSQSAERIAVETETSQLTYSELNARSNQLAHLLRKAGIGPEKVVEVWMEPGEDWVVTIIAVFKAGGIYLPVNDDFPAKRHAYIARSIRPSVVISEADRLDAVEGQLKVNQDHAATHLVGLDHGALHWKKKGEGENWEHSDVPVFPSDNLELVNEGDDGNYIFFTSGSTGEPKAILGCHKSLSHFIHWESSEFGINEAERVSQLTASTFDASLRDVFLPLINGATLVIPSKDTRSNFAKLLDWIVQREISHIHAVPSLFRAMHRLANTDSNLCQHLKRLLLAGEMLHSKDILNFRNLLGSHVEFVNLYGATESTLIKSFHRVLPSDLSSNQPISIGNAISNTLLLVLNEEGKLCQIGEQGEIFIKTPFLSKGYYQNQALTDKSFVQNPLNDKDRDIIYKTGDLGRYQLERTVEVLGRKDDQVKFNGVRVELSEIEGILHGHAAISQAAVILHHPKKAEPQLLAYYVEQASVAQDELQTLLRKNLPPYSLPSMLIRLDEFPLTPNGKVDRTNLPLPGTQSLTERTAGEAPQTELQERLHAIWSDVLGLERVGLDDSFFEIGGHSLVAGIVVARIYRELGLEMKLRAFFDHPTLREQAARLEAMESSETQGSVPLLPEAEDYPVSAVQRRMWIIQRMEPDAGKAYVMHRAFQLAGQIEPQKFVMSLKRLIEVHEILRTVIVEKDSEPRQKVLRNIAIEDCIDFRMMSEGKDPSELIEREKEVTFELDRAPLLRFVIWSISEHEHVLLVSIHHIISDGWSIQSMLKTLLDGYTRFSQEKPMEETLMPFQYKDYAAWNNERVEQRSEEDRAFWLSKMQAPLPAIEFLTPSKRPLEKNYRGSNIRVELPEALTHRLRKECQERGQSVFSALLALYNALLYKYTGQRDIVVGTVTAGREYPGMQEQLGCYVHTLALRQKLDPESTFADLLERSALTIHEALEHQHYPFDQLVDDLQLERDLSRHPLFDVMLVMHNMGERVADESNASTSDSALSIEPFASERHFTKFDLTLHVYEQNDSIAMEWAYSTSIFTSTEIERMTKHFLFLTERLLLHPEPLSAISLTSSGEEKAIQCLGTKLSFEEKTVSQRFSALAKKHPENPALVDSSGSVSYKELHAMSGVVANKLKLLYGVGHGDIVAVTAIPGRNLIASMLGISALGATYLPIDSDTPADRVRLIIDESQSKVLLADDSWDAQEDVSIPVQRLSEVDWSSPNRQEDLAIGEANDAFYVIYTSGSTGRPKGVVVPHLALLNYTTWLGESFNVNTQSASVLWSSPSFDLGYTALWGTLLNGGTLHIPTKDQRNNPVLFVDYLKQHPMTFLKMTPSLFHLLLEEVGESWVAELKTLEYLFLGGEAIRPADLQTFFRQNPNAQIVNHYGPTEATIGCVAKVITASNAVAFSKNPVIGLPIVNTGAWILDGDLQPVPVGIVGELYISGSGLASGYLHQPELTAERFISSPNDQEKMYRTGDLVRWTEEGEIAFIGRNDGQVKLSGYRVEVDEVKRAFLLQDGIDEAEVLTFKEDEVIRLEAFFTSRAGVDTRELREGLRSIIPAYMVPVQIARVEHIPLNDNGKVDFKALRSMAIDVPEEKAAEAGEWSQEEKLMSEFWRKLFPSHDPQRNSHFFELGGDSIRALQLVSKAYQRGYSLKIPDIFRGPTLAEMSQCLTKVEFQIDQQPVEGDVPLSPIQSAFFTWKLENTAHWSQAVMLVASERLETSPLSKALEAICIHHDALRMVFRSTENGWVQHNRSISQKPLFQLDVRDFRKSDQPEEELLEAANHLHCNLDLENGPFLRVGLYKLSEADHLLVSLHHLVSDGVSMRILISDIAEQYEALKAYGSPDLPLKSHSFKDWIEALPKIKSNDQWQQERAFWESLPIDHCEKLPKDMDVVHGPAIESQTLRQALSTEITMRLLTTSGRAFFTEVNDLLMVALSRSFHSWSGIEHLLLRQEGHGREQRDGMDVSRTIGWFTAEFPLILTYRKGEELKEQVKRQKEELRRVPANGFHFGVLKHTVLEEAERAHPVYHASPEVSFNYLGQFDADLSHDLFSLSSMPAGGSVDPNMEKRFSIEINAHVLNGQLEVRWNYSSRQFKENTMKNVLSAFMEELENVVNFCAEFGNSEHTPSDFGDQSLTLSELESIEGLIDDLD